VASYKVVRKLGEGGMGVVYLAHQTSLERKVALKLLTDPMREKGHFAHRFVREVQASTRVSHPNIIKILDFGEIEGRPFYAMEYLEAATLEETYRTLGPLPADVVVKIAEQLLDALACMHRAGLIHRDLKPANAMIDERGHVTLMDLGLVKDLGRTPMTAHGKIVGTPGYLAPETILGKPVDGRADLYSLGVLLYEVLTGQRPFVGDNMQSLLITVIQKPHAPANALRAGVPDWLSGFLDRLLAKDPDKRFPNAGIARRELARASGGEVTPGVSDESIDAILDFTGESAGPVELPSGAIEGGLEELAKVPAGPPERKGPRTRVEKRLTARHAAAAPPAPTPAPPAAARALAPVAAAVAGGIAVAVAYLVAWAPAGPSPSPVATVAAAAPGGVVELGAALEAALARYNPLEKIDAIHAELTKADPKKGVWYDEAPGREVLACRERWKERLWTMGEETGLARALEAFAPRREEFFTSPAVAPAARLAVYLKLHDLIDLRQWCTRVRMAGVPDPGQAFSPAYGMLAKGRLEGQPGVLLEFDHVENYKPEQLQKLVFGPESERIRTGEIERFFARGDSREHDLIGAIEAMGKARLSYEYPRPLPIPPLDRIEELELFGAVSDVATNNRFVVSLAVDSGPMRDVAVVRGDQSDPLRFAHTLERGLFHGAGLRISVRLRLIRDMLAWTEYGNFPRVGLRYRLKR
jgi:hypothetical protein